MGDHTQTRAGDNNRSDFPLERTDQPKTVKNRTEALDDLPDIILFRILGFLDALSVGTASQLSGRIEACALSGALWAALEARIPTKAGASSKPTAFERVCLFEKVAQFAKSTEDAIYQHFALEDEISSAHVHETGYLRWKNSPDNDDCPMPFLLFRDQLNAGHELFLSMSQISTRKHIWQGFTPSCFGSFHDPVEIKLDLRGCGEEIWARFGNTDRDRVGLLTSDTLFTIIAVDTSIEEDAPVLLSFCAFFRGGSDVERPTPRLRMELSILKHHTGSLCVEETGQGLFSLGEGHHLGYRDRHHLIDFDRQSRSTPQLVELSIHELLEDHPFDD
mmetsp:Transcript_178/g.295  ORF Transcript_178/g.295 Transcript_178/m.295 type:complete len:333 (-) Transcript_178:171-1169(-)